jgi:glutathione reductase (NADPH)
MAEFDYDLFVIGAGSGGVRAARLAAMTGARVAVAEESRVGGTCVVRGCVPKKFMVYASEFAHTFELAKSYGWTGLNPVFDWKAFMTAKDVDIARLSGIYATNLLKAGADLFHERATLEDAHTVSMSKDGRLLTAKTILIAVGGRPWLPSPDVLPGIEHAITSDEAFHLDELPRRVLIAGGGYIAVEFAGIFNGLGSEVTIVNRSPGLLRGFDEDVRTHVADELERRGVRVILGTQHERLEKTNTGITHHLTNDISFETDVAMFAVGRRPHTVGLGLAKAGVAVNDNGAVRVDRFSQTSQPSIYAVGDVTDRVNLTPCRHPRGRGLRRDRVPRQPHRLRSRDDTDRGLQPAPRSVRSG